MKINNKLAVIYKKVFSDNYRNYLRKKLSDCNKVLEIGCGRNSPIQYCGTFFSIGVDIFEPYLQESRKKGIHSQYIKADIRKIEFKSDSFDAVLILDAIEHLSKNEGYELILKAQRWAKKKVIIFTPNGFLWQEDYEQNPWQVHKSGWKPQELKNLGFRIYGMSGWIILYGYNRQLKCTQLRFKPTFVWAIISNITQMILYFYPKHAFQLLGIWHKTNK